MSNRDRIKHAIYVMRNAGNYEPLSRSFIFNKGVDIVRANWAIRESVQGGIELI